VAAVSIRVLAIGEPVLGLEIERHFHVEGVADNALSVWHVRDFVQEFPVCKHHHQRRVLARSATSSLRGQSTVRRQQQQTMMSQPPPPASEQQSIVALTLEETSVHRCPEWFDFDTKLLALRCKIISVKCVRFPSHSEYIATERGTYHPSDFQGDSEISYTNDARTVVLGRSAALRKRSGRSTHRRLPRRPVTFHKKISAISTELLNQIYIYNQTRLQ
jgi:hypothetical protein